MSKYGFIGCGNMGGALVRAASNAVSPNDIYVNDFFAAKVEELKVECCVNGADNNYIASSCNFIVLGAKPQTLLVELLPSIAQILKERNNDFVLVSMAAGIHISQIRDAVGFDCPIIRIMPNTPASVGEGMMVYCKNELVSEEKENEFKVLFSRSGKIDSLDEKYFDAATAVMSCGPAFVYLFMEALADGGVKCGLPRDKALLYAEQMIKGAAQTALVTGKHPGALKDAVCSPNGSTIEGVIALEDRGFRGAATNAVIKSYERNKELGK